MCSFFFFFLVGNLEVILFDQRGCFTKRYRIYVISCNLVNFNSPTSIIRLAFEGRVLEDFSV